MPSASVMTRAEAVYQAVRRDILTGALPPASRLRLVELGERFAVSQSVVREALTRLAEQQVVRAIPQQGFRVASLTLDDLVALTEARVHVEGLVLRLAVERGDLTWEASVVATHHHLSRTRLDSEPWEWLAAHEAFHAALLAGCGNDRLLRAAAGLRDAAELYRMWSRPLGDDQGRDLPAEHRGLLEAAVAHDSDHAVALLVAHIERTSSVLVPLAEQGGDGAP